MTTVETTVDPVHLDRLRRAAFVTLVLLLIQFALGIGANLYVTVPAHHPGARPGSYFSGSLQSLGWALHHARAVLAAHTALGFVIVLAAVGLVVQTARLRRGRLLAAATLGTLSVIGAGFNGASFLDYNKDVNSLIMALLFALAMFCYLLILYGTPGNSRVPSVTLD
jgi:membrane-associated PAP2 superfamily phosphatase